MNKPFYYLYNLDYLELLKFIKNEKPLTIAIVLSYMKPNIVASILNKLNDQLKFKTIILFSNLKNISSNKVNNISSLLYLKYQI